MLVVPVQDPGLRTSLQELPAVEEPAEDPLGHRPEETPRPSPGQGSYQDHGAVRGRTVQSGDLDFIATKDVGKTSPPVATAEDEAGSGVSAWENREREEHLAQLAEEEARLGGEE